MAARCLTVPLERYGSPVFDSWIFIRARQSVGAPALESLTRSWALELAPFGVRVNAIAPGPTDTPVFEKLGLPKEAIPVAKAQFVKQVPLGRIASTDEIVHGIVALADPSVTWVNEWGSSVGGWGDEPGMSLT